jgi:predicted nuclease of restriction endonuclease-like RecB superfamily
MLTTDLLIYRRNGDTLIPKCLPLNTSHLELATQQINCFQTSLGITQGELDKKLLELEGDSPDYRIMRGFTHLLKSHFSTFEIISPLEPQQLREKVFSQSVKVCPIPENRPQILETLASQLSQELNLEVLPSQIEKGLYADLEENRIFNQFEAPSPEALIHRYNLSQVQGVFYKASHIIINAHRNDPGEYKMLFRYLKLFQLMTYIEGDADTGFTLTIDGPTSLFKASTRYGLSLAKMIPALLHVTKWTLQATLHYKDPYSGDVKKERFSLDDKCGLVSHYPPGKPYDSMLEESFAKRWEQLDTPWRLEREVDLVPLPGGVMIPDFRLIHEDGRDFLLEIVGYWRPEYLQKKFSQVRRAADQNLILAVSERLNLEKAGVKFTDLPNRIIWFKDKLSPRAVLEVLDE